MELGFKEHCSFEGSGYIGADERPCQENGHTQDWMKLSTCCQGQPIVNRDRGNTNHARNSRSETEDQRDDEAVGYTISDIAC